VTDLITAPAGIVVAPHLFAEAYRDPRLASRPARRRHTALRVTSAAAGGPLGLTWAPCDDRRLCAPSGPYWCSIEHAGTAGWHWTVTDSWIALRITEGAASSLRGAIVQAELAVLLRTLGLSSVAVAATIAFGDWPTEAVC